jgi:hypothetical protein
MSDRGEQLNGSSANRATLCELIAQREAEYAKLRQEIEGRDRLLKTLRGENAGLLAACDSLTMDNDALLENDE